MSVYIIDKRKCTGCGACANICPKKCIELEEDECGFEYPHVFRAACVNCGLCENVCPLMKDEEQFPNEILSVYAGWNKDEEVRMASTSGGIFSALANCILEEGGCVAGAEYFSPDRIRHTIISQKCDVSRLRQSKYAQSQTGWIYQDVKQALKRGKVLFCGTPCQVSGLLSYLGGKTENLYTMDFICRGVNSPRAYREWLKEIEKEYGKKVEKVWFKYKEDGWKKSPKCTRIEFGNGDYIVLKGEENAFMTGYLGPNLFIRPSCGDCIFKGIKRVSDITVGDFWGIEKELDDDRGTSLLLVNSSRGEELIQSISDRVCLTEKSVEEITEGNVCFSGSVKINKNSEKFLASLGTCSFCTLVKKYSGRSFAVRIRGRLKRVFS